MPRKPTNAELQEDLDNASIRINGLNEKLRNFEQKCTEDRKKIRTLKAIARHYKGQRDEVNAYLSAVLDLVVEKDVVDLPVQKPEYYEHDVMFRKETRMPALQRPSMHEPGGQLPDEPFSSLMGRMDDTKTHWEDL